MMQKRALLSIVAAIGVQTAFLLPAQGQSTTLIGSVRTDTTPSPTPVLKKQAAKIDRRQGTDAPRSVATPPTRTIIKTVIVEKRDNRTYFQKHPKVKAAVIGAGAGAGAGAITGLISRRGIFRGAAVGAGSGAGIGLIRASKTMKRHPIIRDVTTGTIAGLGLGAAASRRGGTIAKSSAVGAAIGLGYSLFKRLK